MKDLNIFNGFGIAPTTNYEAAGHDFYVPNIHGLENSNLILSAFEESYKKTEDELEEITRLLGAYVSGVHGAEKYENNELNILHLYLATKSPYLSSHLGIDCSVGRFVDDYLMFDSENRPGVRLRLNDHIFINSGIKVALDKDTAGIFFNKSGKGNKGFDVRACVVDEDYAGYVHLSLAYTKDNNDDGVIFCGDKITQMVILPVIHHKDVVELTEEEYNKKMDKSKRGSAGFGSSDEKH